MRNLTILRQKYSAGCLSRVKVYIEDHDNGKMTINGVPCRKLGNLKNGEAKTFEIEEQACRIFTIAGPMSKGYTSDCYQLPAGQEDVSLTGRCCFNPAIGNAFRFDNNNDDEEAVANRRRGLKRGWIILAISVTVGAVAGFLIGIGSGILFGRAPVERTFSESGMTITLTDRFSKLSLDGFEAAFGSDEVSVFALKEPFTLMEGMADMTPDEYAEITIKNNGLSESSPSSVNGQVRFSYDVFLEEVNDTVHYVAYVYKTDDAFWMVQFATKASLADEYAARIETWARSVTIE